MTKIGIVLVLAGSALLYLFACAGFSPEAFKGKEKAGLGAKAMIPLGKNMPFLGGAAALLAAGIFALSRGKAPASALSERFAAPAGPDRTAEQGLFLSGLLGAAAVAVAVAMAKGTGKPEPLGALFLWAGAQAAAGVVLLALAFMKKGRSNALFFPGALLTVVQIAFVIGVVVLGG